MEKCWEVRGCDEEMSSRCPHTRALGHPSCPAECNYTICDRPTRHIETDVALLLDATIDRTAAIKDACQVCSYFLRNAPRRKDPAS